MRWGFWKKGKEEIRIVLATRDSSVLAALEKLEIPYEISAEAITCDGVYRALSDGADLVIADPNQLATISLSPEGLLEVISSSGVPLATPSEFAADPISWQEAALAAKGEISHLPSRLVAVTSYSGGVGKTTISLDMAALFHLKTELPTMVMEFVAGVSALRAICNMEAPSLYDCITEGLRPAEWRGVDILPMDFALARTLPARSIANFLSKERRAHVLTIVDSPFQHPLLGEVLEEVPPDVWLIVGDPKPDALYNAEKLAEELSSERWGGAENSRRVVINMVRGSRLSLLGVDRDLALPFIKAPERYEGKLGGRVLKLIYPTWR